MGPIKARTALIIIVTAAVIGVLVAWYLLRVRSPAPRVVPDRVVVVDRVAVGLEDLSEDVQLVAATAPPSLWIR
jgi:hypothetical protein